MDIIQLCSEINLQPAIKAQILQVLKTFDFSEADPLLKDFFEYDKMKRARIGLCAVLGEDQDHIKMLTCMLRASVRAYDVYEKKGISRETYIATMKCYTRFIQETYKMTGKLCFDRYWWTTRQAGCHLYRLGELEYETVPVGKETVIEMHIPSDADFSPSAVDASIEMARGFFGEYYPELSDCEYRCHSWLLDPQLKDMLSEGSNILNFQDRFELYDSGENDEEFIEWLFNSRTKDYQSLPENTSLQKKVKNLLLNQGTIRTACGRLKV